jgi:hypothetical protein
MHLSGNAIDASTTNSLLLPARRLWQCDIDRDHIFSFTAHPCLYVDNKQTTLLTMHKHLNVYYK